MPSLGERKCLFHGFSIANFADHDHVWRLSERALQSSLPTPRVDSNLTLIKNAFFVLMRKFNRIFYGNNMAARMGIAIVQHSGQRSRFTRAGCTDK